MSDDMHRLYEAYRRGIPLPAQDILPEETFGAYAFSALRGSERIAAEDKGREGFLYYFSRTEAGRKEVCVPVYGYFAESGRMAVRLFQRLGEASMRDMPVSFSVRLYASDTESLDAFHCMQFGTMAEKGFRILSGYEGKTAAGVEIRALGKSEIRKNWKAVWAMTDSIVKHLQKSPVFYPGTEFTEEVYREFFLEEGTELIAAYVDGKLSGIIEWNLEEEPLLFSPGTSVNVGEAYVLPELRGTGLAESLLGAAENRALSAGFQYMWVEHGTANPNARGFWNKYFRTYQYELVRTAAPL